MSDARMRDLPAHAESRLTHKLDVNTLAAFVAMSPRTFARQFEGNFGTTPAGGFDRFGWKPRDSIWNLAIYRLKRSHALPVFATNKHSVEHSSSK